MVPDHETVKQIMNEVYNKFYLKWRNTLTVDNAGEMINEVHELERKYPYDLCKSNLVLLVESIDEQYRRRMNI